MALESRPGSPASISLGGNYAQPSNSSGSIPEGTAILRSCWAGDRNAGAPSYIQGDERFFYDLLIGDESSPTDPNHINIKHLVDVKRGNEPARISRGRVT